MYSLMWVLFSGGSITVEDVENSPEFKDKVKLLFVSYSSRELIENGEKPVSAEIPKQILKR